MIRIRHVMLATLMGALIGAGAFPALAQQPAPQVKPLPLEEVRAVFHGMIGLCLEAKARNQRVQELPAEMREKLALTPAPVVRMAGSSDTGIHYWNSQRTLGVSLDNARGECTVSMRSIDAYQGTFDAVAEMKSAGDILLAGLPGYSERRFYPIESSLAGRRFVQDTPERRKVAHVAAYKSNSVSVHTAGEAPWQYTLTSRFRDFDHCIRKLHEQEKFALAGFEKRSLTRSASPLEGYVFYWQTPPQYKAQPYLALGENPAAPQTCVAFDRGIGLEEARKFIPERLNAATITLSKAKGGGVLMLARLDPVLLAP